MVIGEDEDESKNEEDLVQEDTMKGAEPDVGVLDPKRQRRALDEK